METNKQDSPQSLDLFDPLSGWQAAARWNAASWNWMAKGWQQWLALMTTLPPQFIAPPTVQSRRIAVRQRAEAAPAARAGAERPVRARSKRSAPARRGKA